MLCQAEAIHNSRPPRPLSNDPNDLLPLISGNFLIGNTLNALPQIDLYDVPQNKLVLNEELQKLVQHFWKR